MWDSKVMPYLEAQSRGASRDPGRGTPEPGRGRRANMAIREKQDGSPWTCRYEVRRAGSSPRIRRRARRRSASTSTATARPMPRIQIGPAIRGTALRDTLDFVSFNIVHEPDRVCPVRQGASIRVWTALSSRACRAISWSAARCPCSAPFRWKSSTSRRSSRRPNSHWGRSRDLAG